MAFFRGFPIALAYRTVRSTFAPRSLGAALASPAPRPSSPSWRVPNTLRFAVIAPRGVAELALLIWLIARGVQPGLGRLHPRQAGPKIDLAAAVTAEDLRDLARM